MGNLTDLQIRSWLKKEERFEGRSDGGELYLRYRTSDKKPTWRFRYRMLGKWRVVCLGNYPDVTLSKAREVARELSARVALGFDVAEKKKERKAGFLAKLNEDNNEKTVADIANSFYEQLILPRHKRP